MTKADRKKGPAISSISQIDFPPYERIDTNTGSPIYVIKAGTQDVLKLEFVFYAGRYYEPKQLVSRATASLLKEGTKNHNGGEIATILDYYGSTLHARAGMDTSSMTLYCLKKQFSSLLPTVMEVIREPSFVQHELDQFIEKAQHRLKIELQKNDVLAYRMLTELIFGDKHPYGYNSTPDLYQGVQREDILSFHEKHYTAKNMAIFISGKVDDTIIAQLIESIGLLPIGSKSIRQEAIYSDSQKGRHLVKSNHGFQSAIRIGKRLFNRDHPDFHGMSFLTTILGGYFGSRLMKNIREDKGYTYNIDCSVDTMIHDGYFQVGTEVAHENVEQTITEIYNEIDRLKQEPVGADELNMVKNYLIGNLLHLIDGPFNISKMFKTIFLTSNDASYLNSTVEGILGITPDQIQSHANTYFDQESLFEVVVGA